MADDNIVRPEFGAKKPRPIETTTPQRGQDSLRNFVRATADESWAGKFRVETPDGKPNEREIEMRGFSTILGTFDLKDILSKLVQRHEGKIQQYKTLVEGYTDDDLQAWLDNPKDSDLQRKPYFFHALIDEANRRFLYPQRRPPKEGPDQGATEVYKDPGREVIDDYKQIGPLEGEALLRAQKDLIYMLANQDVVNAMRNKLEAAGDTIFSLTGYTPDQESIQLRREGLKSHTLEEICQEIDKTNQLQWRRQPSYLGALTLEHNARVQMALSLMNEKGKGPE